MHSVPHETEVFLSHIGYASFKSIFVSQLLGWTGSLAVWIPSILKWQVWTNWFNFLSWSITSLIFPWTRNIFDYKPSRDALSEAESSDIAPFDILEDILSWVLFCWALPNVAGRKSPLLGYSLFGCGYAFSNCGWNVHPSSMQGEFRDMPLVVPTPLYMLWTLNLTWQFLNIFYFVNYF